MSYDAFRPPSSSGNAGGGNSHTYFNPNLGVGGGGYSSSASSSDGMMMNNQDAFGTIGSSSASTTTHRRPHYQQQPSMNTPSASMVGGVSPSTTTPVAAPLYQSQTGYVGGAMDMHSPAYGFQIPNAPIAWEQFAPNDPMLQAGMQTGLTLAQKKAQESMNMYMPGMSMFWLSLRNLFAVSNKYVVSKIFLLIFPFQMKRVWTRGMKHDDPSTQSLPMDDHNAPDLYIPLMSFITYVLLVGFLKGSRNEDFSPEILLDTFGSATGTQAFEIAAMRFGIYLLGTAAVVNVPYLEMVAFTGYKYLLVSICLVVGIMMPAAYTLTVIYAAVSMSFFMFKVLQSNIQTEHQRVYLFTLFCAGLQALTIIYLAYSRELGLGVSDLLSLFKSSSTTTMAIKSGTKASLPPSMMVATANSDVNSSDDLDI